MTDFTPLASTHLDIVQKPLSTFEEYIFAAVLPNLVQQPPLVMNLPAFMEVDHEARLPALASLCEKERAHKWQASQKTPHPEQGGEWISAMWL